MGPPIRGYQSIIGNRPGRSGIIEAEEQPYVPPTSNMDNDNKGPENPPAYGLASASTSGNDTQNVFNGASATRFGGWTYPNIVCDPPAPEKDGGNKAKSPNPPASNDNCSNKEAPSQPKETRSDVFSATAEPCVSGEDSFSEDGEEDSFVPGEGSASKDSEQDSFSEDGEEDCSAEDGEEDCSTEDGEEDFSAEDGDEDSSSKDGKKTFEEMLAEIDAQQKIIPTLEFELISKTEEHEIAREEFQKILFEMAQTANKAGEPFIYEERIKVIKDYEEGIRKLEEAGAELGSLEETIETRESMLAFKNERIKAIDERIDVIRSMNSNNWRRYCMRQDQAILRNRIKASKDKVLSLQQQTMEIGKAELASNEERIKASETRQAQIEETMKAEGVESQQQIIKTLESELAARGEEHTKALDEREKALDERSKAENELSEARDELIKVQEEFSKADDERQKAYAEYGKACDKRRDFCYDHERRNSPYDEDYYKGIVPLREDADKLHELWESCWDRESTVHYRIGDIRIGIEALKKRITAIEQRIETIDERSKDNEAHQKNLRESIALATKIAKLQSAQLQTIETQKAELASRDERIKASESHQKNLRESIALATKDAESQSARLQTIETQKAELETRQTQMEEKIKAERAEIESLQQKIESQNLELAAGIDVYTKASEVRDDALHELEEANAELSSQKQTIESQNSKLASRQEYIKSLKATNTRLEGRIESLTREHDTERKRLARLAEGLKKMIGEIESEVNGQDTEPGRKVQEQDTKSERILDAFKTWILKKKGTTPEYMAEWLTDMDENL